MKNLFTAFTFWFLFYVMPLGQSVSFKTYMNPVKPGDHQDCTLTKVGNGFYTAGSSFNPIPVINHSTDFVHWEAIAQPVSAVWDGYGSQPAGRCWSGLVVNYKNKWWDFFSHKNTMYFVTADSVKSPWSIPTLMKTPSQVPGLGYNNSIFIDENGNRYLVSKNGQVNNWIVQLGPDGQPIGKVYNLTWLNPSPNYPYSCAEGPVMGRCGNNNEWYGQGRQGLLNQASYNSNDMPVADYPINSPNPAPDLPGSGIPWMEPHTDFFDSTTLNSEYNFYGTGSWTALKTFSAKLSSKISVLHDVYLLFAGSLTGELFGLQSFYFTGSGSVTGIPGKSLGGNIIPKKYELEQNYPNPFNPYTSITFSIQKESKVKVTIYNQLGQQVLVLAEESNTTDVHSLDFNAGNFASKVYDYRKKTGSFIETKKMILMKQYHNIFN